MLALSPLLQRYLQHLLPSYGQSQVPALQATFHVPRSGPLRHVHLDEDLFHGLVPASPRSGAGHEPAPLFERRRHLFGRTSLKKTHALLPGCRSSELLRLSSELFRVPGFRQLLTTPPIDPERGEKV
ncbi:hypothetical protein L345_06987, partial [Ophiophagus hannah]